MKRSIYLERALSMAVGARALPCLVLLACGSSATDADAPPPAPSMQATAGAAGASAAAPSRTGAPPEDRGDGLAAAPGSRPITEAEPTPASCAAADADACAACVCERCEAELRACAETAGCAEILVCVRESGCSGAACFCGDVDPLACLSGNAAGPCRDVILAAPGSRAPTALDPSAGPASDAVLGVGECAEDADACGDSCAID